MGLFGSREESPRARSTEEREAARRAREAERAARRGEPPPDFAEPPAAPPRPARTERRAPEPAPPSRREQPTAAPAAPTPHREVDAPAAPSRRQPPAPRRPTPAGQPPPRRSPAPSPAQRADPVPEPVGRYTGPPSPTAPAHDDVEQPTAAWKTVQEDGAQAGSERKMQRWEKPSEAGRDGERAPADAPSATTDDGNGNGASAHSPSPATEEPAYHLDHQDLGHDDDLGHEDDLGHDGHDGDVAWHDEAATGEFVAQGYVQPPAPAPERRPAPDAVPPAPEPEPAREPESGQGSARGRFSQRMPRPPGPPPRAAGGGRVGRTTKRIGGRGAPVAAVTAGDAAAPGPPGPPGRRGRRPLALALFLAPVIAIVWFLSALFQPFGGDGEGTVAVTIPEGASVGEIGDILAEEGVVDSGLFFRLRATLSGDGAALRSGPHELRKDMSYSAAISAISTPPAAAGAGEVIDVTIPEGLSRSEIAPVVEQAGVDGDYVEASLGQKGFSTDDYGAPEDTGSLEGFLFPSTYELSVEDNAEDLVSKQLEAFQENLSKVDLAKAEKGNLTPYEVLIIASMVERETSVPEERPLVAAVIYNRLADGMKLGIDATIRYANDNWDSPLKKSELEEDGPYNTRTRIGLPPTPIGNPGLASIQAAANPADEDILYYVVKPGTCGEHNFSSTDAEFQRDVAEYNRARDAAGGKSPTTC